MYTQYYSDWRPVNHLRRTDNKRSQQSLMEGATSEDLKGNLSKQVMIDAVIVCRPFQRHETAKKVHGTAGNQTQDIWL